ncbi:MAG: glycosyltransferase family 1 protein [Thermoanaerobaculum sp.]|nr:glycosyltransferase family 1 protein [Thermoanaerobaculum sp.]
MLGPNRFGHPSAAWRDRTSNGCIQVFLDTWPLQTPSALQGIGRYTLGLASGFSALEAKGALPLAVAGLRFAGQAWHVVALEELSQGKGQPPPRADTPHCSWRRRFASRACLRRLGCRILHLPEPACMPLAAGVSLVLTVHDLIPLEFPHLYSRKAPRLRYLLNRALTRLRLLAADHVVADSQYVSHRLRALFGVPEEKITVAYPGVDLHRYTPTPQPQEREWLRTQLGISPPFFLYVGTADPRKNLGFLLEALAFVQNRVPLVVAGALHPLHRQSLEAKIAQLGLEGLVQLVGFVDEGMLPALYRQSLALLFPSLSEGFGLPILEAMACGTPVVAFAHSAVKELFAEAAWLVPTNHMPDFVGAMTTLASSVEKRQALREKGLAWAPRFTWEATAQQVVTAYQKVLGKAP